MKTLIRLTFVFIAILQQISSIAQPSKQINSPNGITISGIVLDKITSQPIEYANIGIFRAKDSSMVNGTVSDAEGVFKLDGLKADKYYLKISFIGYKTKLVPDISLSTQQKEMNLGKISVEANEANLGEVTVTTDRKTIEFNLDKKVVNVASNMAATVGGTAVDVLQNVPSVTVDQDGNVSLRGNENVTILIDGRPSSLTGANLKQIPASAIETVELVTNPSARYNPEGVSGIINIKLKKKLDTGFNGVANVTVGTQEKYNASVNLNYNMGRVNFFSSFDYRDDKRPGDGNSNKKSYLYGNDNISFVDTSFYTDLSETKRRGISKGIKLGTDLLLNKKNTLTLTWMGRFGNDDDIDITDADITYSNNYYKYLNSLKKSYQKETENSKSFDYTLNYRKTFDKKEQEFTADVIINQREDNEDFYQNIDATGETTYTTKNLSNTTGKNNTSTFQFNYVYPFAKKWKLETGWQSKLIDLSSQYNYFNVKDNQEIKSETNSYDLAYSQYVHGAYGTIGGNFGKYSMQLGLRLEQSYITLKQNESGTKFTDSYFQPFPTIHISRKLDGDRDIQLSYSRRINRPNMRMLNPAQDYSNPNMVRSGNPELKPEYINSYELGYTRQLKKSSINFTLFYRKTNDVINRTQRNETDPNTGEIMTYTRPENITSAQSYGIELIAETALAKWWRISGNASFFKNKVKDNGEFSGESMTNDNYSYNARIMSNMMIPKLFTLQISGFYRGPMVQINSEMDAMYSIDAAIQKSVLKDKLAIALRVSDIFKTMKFNTNTFGTTFYNEMERKFNSQVFYLSLTYKIGGGIKTQKGKTNGNNNSSDENIDF